MVRIDGETEIGPLWQIEESETGGEITRRLGETSARAHLDDALATLEGAPLHDDPIGRFLPYTASRALAGADAKALAETGSGVVRETVRLMLHRRGYHAVLWYDEGRTHLEIENPVPMTRFSLEVRRAPGPVLSTLAAAALLSIARRTEPGVWIAPGPLVRKLAGGLDDALALAYLKFRIDHRGEGHRTRLTAFHDAPGQDERVH